METRGCMVKKEFDIIIIGSGAAGGVVAKELSSLCKDGVKIAVLEWGARLKKDEFTCKELEMANRLYFDGGGFLTRDRSITFALGRAYGGSTVVYTGTSFIMPQNVLENWNVVGLDWEDIFRRSEKYFDECSVHVLEEDKINENNKLFFAACKKLGLSVSQFPINVKNCQGAGVCNIGCPHEAKQGTHVVQLPQAEKNGVVVVTNCRVERIGERVCYAKVENRNYGLPSVWEPGEYEIRAKIIVVCAGAVNTPAIFLRSNLPIDSPVIGRYFTCHPALILVAQHDRAITNFYGHPKSYFCDHFVESKKFLLEVCMYYPLSTAKSLVGFGKELGELMSNMDRLQMIIAIALDSAAYENRIAIDKEGNPVIDYRVSEHVLDSLFEAQKILAKIFFASGAKRVHAPAGKEFFIEASEKEQVDKLILKEKMRLGRIPLSSAHPMGGCRMGDDIKSSVTTEWGQVHGVEWLYVADASLFPDSAGVNPYITVMALADRVAERVKLKARELLSR